MSKYLNISAIGQVLIIVSILALFTLSASSLLAVVKQAAIKSESTRVSEVRACQFSSEATAEVEFAGCNSLL